MNLCDNFNPFFLSKYPLKIVMRDSAVSKGSLKPPGLNIFVGHTLKLF